MRNGKRQQVIQSQSSSPGQGALPGSALAALDASLPLVAFAFRDHPFIRLVLWPYCLNVIISGPFSANRAPRMTQTSPVRKNIGGKRKRVHTCLIA